MNETEKVDFLLSNGLTGTVWALAFTDCRLCRLFSDFCRNCSFIDETILSEIFVFSLA